MEKLLNKLIEKGWCPMGNKPITQLKKNVKVERYNKKPMAVVIKNGRKYADDYYSLRDLVSKESGLWQFVCGNGMLSETNQGVWANAVDNHFKELLFKYNDYQYRLIESALCDEDELEQFLLNNIKIDE